jgi:hypothetical protein
MRGHLRLVVVVGLLLLTSAVARAQPTTVYSNFGAGFSFDTDPFHGWTINGFLAPGVGQQGISNRFTPAETVTFTGARLALSLWSPPANVLVVLQQDNGGLPGTVLEQITVGSLGYSPAVYAVTSVLHPQLQAGAHYWLTVLAPNAGSLAGWQWNATGDVSAGGNFAGTQGGVASGPWGLNPNPVVRGAFQVEGTLVGVVVGIEIKPGEFPNPINVRSAGKTPVAILSDGSFDAASIDPASVRFGATGHEAASARASLEDVDGDGDLDLVLHFPTAHSGLRCGDTAALVTGVTSSGTPIRGADSIVTVGCR